MKPAVCERCGAPIMKGSDACSYCGVAFIAPAAAAAPASPSPGLPENVVASLRAGKTIDAIRLYREYAKCGLREAKEAVEAYLAAWPR